MPAEEKESAAVELHEHGVSHLSGALSPIVYHLGFWVAVYLPTRFLHPETPINLLAVQEEVGAEGPYLLNNLATDHEAGPQRVVDLEVLPICVLAVPTVESGVGEAMVEGKKVQEGHPQVGEPKGPVLKGAIRIKEGPGHGPNSGVVLQEARQLGYGIPKDNSVWIQKEEAPPLRTLHRDVVSSGEPQVTIKGYQLHLGEGRSDHFGTAVPGGVVYHEDLVFQPRGVGREAVYDRG